MQFTTTALFSVLVTFAAAASIPFERRNVPGLNCGTIDALKCAAALGPGVVSCIAAAVQAGVDPIADAGCAVSVGNDIANFPESCSTCF